jgi:hypothetical protein
VSDHFADEVAPTRLHRCVDQHLGEEIALRIAAGQPPDLLTPRGASRSTTRVTSPWRTGLLASADLPPSNTTRQSAKPIEVQPTYRITNGFTIYSRWLRSAR